MNSHYSPEEEIIVTVGATLKLYLPVWLTLNLAKVIVPPPNHVIYETPKFVSLEQNSSRSRC